METGPDTYLVMAVAGAAALTLIAVLRGNVRCEQCGAKLPSLRIPGTAAHAMQGGWTCPECGADLDRNGKLKR